MSVVTNVLLSLGVLDGEVTPNRIEEVNRYFGDSCKGLVSVHDSTLPHCWYGGSKALEADIFIGAFNLLDLQAFLGYLRSIPWKQRDCVQLFIKEQEDERFRLLNLFE
jgi:hypothetical protein